jgi:hypothetical protein
LIRNSGIRKKWELYQTIKRIMAKKTLNNLDTLSNFRGKLNANFDDLYDNDIAIWWVKTYTSNMILSKSYPKITLDWATEASDVWVEYESSQWTWKVWQWIWTATHTFVIYDITNSASRFAIDSAGAITTAWTVNWQTLSDSWWITPTLLNGWINYWSPRATAQYRKEWNKVTIKWLLKGGTSWDIFTLPVWYRPTDSRIYTWFRNLLWWSDVAYRFNVNSNWNVESSQTWLSTDRFSIECNFTI